MEYIFLIMCASSHSKRLPLRQYFLEFTGELHIKNENSRVQEGKSQQEKKKSLQLYTCSPWGERQRRTKEGSFRKILRCVEDCRHQVSLALLSAPPPIPSFPNQLLGLGTSSPRTKPS
jgi:hypothetical protein